MAYWKEKGYVPDSDEEDESQEFVIRETSTTIQETNRRRGEDIEKTASDQAGGNDQKSEPDCGAAWDSTKKNVVLGAPKLNSTDTNADADVCDIQTNLYEASAEARLQAELQAHLFPEVGSQREVPPTRSSSQSAAPDISRASSPLSEAPSSFPDLPVLLGLTEDGLDNRGDGVVLGSRMPSSSSSVALANENEPYHFPSKPQVTGRPGRTLRQRNAIQLHPYVIEKEKYNQAWRSRGLKPLHILQQEAARAHIHDEDSQNFELSEDEADPRSSPLARTTALPLSQASLRDTTPGIVGNDDFPDVDALLRDTFSGIATHDHKRRKINPRFRKPPAVSPQHQSLPRVAHNLSLPDNDSALFNVPPSPPLSGTQTPHEPNDISEPHFRLPPRLTSPAFPTPLTSSEPRRRPSRNQEETHTLSPIGQLAHESSDGVSFLSEDEISHELEHVQRRIKGVLPASWLKMDLRTQVKKPQRHCGNLLSSSPVKNRDQRGVARPVTKNGSNSSSRMDSRQEIFVLSDDDSVGSDAHSLRYDDSDEDERPVTSRLGEAIEDDCIDTMLPPSRRSRLKPKKTRSRQTKIADFSVQRKHTATKSRRLSTTHKQQPNNATQSRKASSETRVRPPYLSVLDASGQQLTQPTPLPSFVRIATRTARSRHDRGRHSPSRKYLRLATREDDIDLHETMSAWRGGSITPIHVADMPQPRQPLQPRSANDAPRISPLEFTSNLKQTKMATTTSKPINLRSQPSRPKKVHMSLDHLVRRRLPQGRDIPNSDHLPSHLRSQDKGGAKNTQLFLALQTLDDSRPAVLESCQTRQDQLHPQSAFSRGLSLFSKAAYDHQGLRPALDRFLHDEEPHATLNKAEILTKTAGTDSDAHKLIRSGPIKIKKRRPRRLDVATLRSRESTSPVIVDEIPDDKEPLLIREIRQTGQVQGLHPFGTRYTATFDVTPLPPGTCFDESTFLGSGDFQNSLTLIPSSDLDGPRGIAFINRSYKEFQWGPWNEIVSSEMAEVFECIQKGAQDLVRSDLELDAPVPMDAITLLTAIISYFATHLSFSDPVDRLPFLQRCSGLLSAFWNGHSQLTAVITGVSVPDNATMQAGIRIAMLGLVLTAQLYQISEHCLIPPQLRDEIQTLIGIGAKWTFAAIRTSLGEFEQYLFKFRCMRNAGKLMRIDQPTIEAFIIAHHVLQRTSIRSLNVLDLVQSTLPPVPADNIVDISSSEAAWQRCFSLLPFLEFDEKGVLDVYVQNPRHQAPAFNGYCRSLFGRCLHLINGWGWYWCDSIIGTLFDFFAQNSLGNLRHEESHGSPPFLENLHQNPALAAEPEDRCFHLLLKIIGSGLKHMRQVHSSKKIRDLVWRLMPNHGRSHPKEQAIRQEDLEALRNHHDLLCTLYWASPPGFRPSVNAIRSLVDLEQSHREACHISIRAWFNLVKFQLSTNESLECLVPLTQWHTDFLEHMLRQHGLARTEAEDQVRSAQYINGLSVSKQLLESTIAKNQQQVEAVLEHALVCLELAVAAAKTQELAGSLLSPALSGVFSPVDGSEKPANEVVIKALSVLLAYTKHCSSKSRQANIYNDNDDSQDYGDWSAFNGNDNFDAEPIKQASAPLLQMTAPLRSLLSNCFGADTAPHESLLTKLIDTWVAVSRVLVDDGVKSYDNYLGQFGNDTWTALRDTDQTRRYAAYFLSTFIETDVRLFRRNRPSTLAHWLGSMVERDSLLKFQHKLTSALLNAEPNDPLLINLPFWKSNSNAPFNISLVDFSERRVLLISCVLSNMRTSLDAACLDSSKVAAQLKQEYKDLLKHLMTTMKRNYTELGQSSNVRGAYVDFVHRVVGLLQEHTSSIYPVDRFFTDSAAFPLPVYDPNYVVGQLKNYGLRLSDSRTPKQLAVFLQSVSERATADGLQGYLVKQLHEAMSISSKDAHPTPTLREFMIQAVVPAYIQVAFESSVGWVLAMPFLKALKNVFEGIHLGLDICDAGAVDKVTSYTMTFLDSIYTAVFPLIGQSQVFASTTILKTFAFCFEAITAVLPTLDYILRTRSQGAHDAIRHYVTFFRSFSAYADAMVEPMEGIESGTFDAPRTLCTRKARFDKVYSFVIHELRNTLRKNWVRMDEDYFFIQGSSRRQIMIDIGSFEEERDTLRLALHEFGNCLSTLPSLGGWEQWCEVAKRVQTGAEVDSLML